jgi:dTDP-4-amino-4,6-dideoxygalactose transaminase
MIPCANPAAQYKSHSKAIRAAITRVLETQAYILGPEVGNFEKAFATYIGTKHAVGVASGTDALVLALKAMGIGTDDEVITVSHTALATVAAVLASGATPVLADIDPTHYTLDPKAVTAAVTKKTKAIIAVHLYGQAADLDALKKIARANKLKLIEDCAQCTGGFYKSRRLGSIGDASTFSFYPTKNLGAIGDGGAVATNDAKLAARIARLRQYGWNAARETEEVGINSRLDPLQAAILGVKLAALDSDNAKRAKLAARYTKELRGLPLTPPALRPDSQHVFHLYVMGCKDRDSLKKSLAADGIDAGIHYPVPAHRHGGYDKKVRLPRGGLPVTDRLVDNIITLPLYPELKLADANRVIAAVHKHYGR